MSYILGISAFYHDSAATLIHNGKIVAAAQEERFTRIKHDSNYPYNAIEFVLGFAKLKLKDLDYIVFYEKPFLKFERLLETYVAFAPKGFKSFCKSIPLWLKEKLFQKNLIFNKLKKHDKNFNDINKMHFSEHHLSHAASAFYPSPFEEAIILTADGVGEWGTTSVAIGKKNKLEIIKEIHFPHSLGLLYTAFTYYTGFKVNSGEYKLMGLAPYGEPKFKDLILKEIVDLKEDGTFWLNQDYFDYCTGLTMTSPKFNDLMGGPPRKEEQDISQRDMDIASSIQSVTEEIVLQLTRSLAKDFSSSNLCLAGGVALNCVANGKLIKEGSFKNVWIQPAAGEAGGAIGAALAVNHRELGAPRIVDRNDSMRGAFLGPVFDDDEVAADLRSCGAIFETVDEGQMISLTADALAGGKAVGWFQGRMEFGPRALGGRSILADPRSDSMQRTLNLKIKFRESFRPFAPSVLAEDVDKYFRLDSSSPYMLLVADVNEDLRISETGEEAQLFGIEKLNVARSTIPAVTHVDYSARIQTVHNETNPRYYALLNAFRERTGCSVLVNTSFNVRGEPIVGTPADAFRCFMGTELDLLVIGRLMLRKENQNPVLAEDYRDRYELD